MAATPCHLDINVDGKVYPLKLSLDPEEFSHKLIISHLKSNSLYEPEASSLLISMLKDGDWFIDVGAHVGYFSLLAASFVGTRGRVFAFEPEETNYRRLLHHVRINQFANVVPLHCAVGAANQVLDFFINADNDGGHALWNPGLHSFNVKSRQAMETRPVFAIALDELFAQLKPGTIKAIKIDTEGNELNVLKGARRILSDGQVRLIVCEINAFGLQQMGATEAELRSFICSFGYEAHTFTPETGLVRLRADQTVKSGYVFNLYFMRPEA